MCYVLLRYQVCDSNCQLLDWLITSWSAFWQSDFPGVGEREGGEEEDIDLYLYSFGMNMKGEGGGGEMSAEKVLIKSSL